MGAIPLQVKTRKTGKKESKRLRREELVPGVFYFRGEESMPIVAEPLSMRPVVYTSAMKIIELELEGENEIRECILKDITFDPITDKITHFDLMGIKRGELITVEIPIKLSGQAAGEKHGGMVQSTIRKVTVKCLPKDLPEHFELDITALKIGDSLTLGDIISENMEFDLPKESVIVSIIPPRVSIAEEEAAEAAAAELLEREEAAEGEEAAD